MERHSNYHHGIFLNCFFVHEQTKSDIFQYKLYFFHPIVEHAGSEPEWLKPNIEVQSEKMHDNINITPTSPKGNTEPHTYSDHVRNLPPSENLRSSLTEESSEETQATFFDSPQLFSASSSLTSSTSPPTSGVPFPRKLPEISTRQDDVIDHRSVAIGRLKHVLEGIRYFDRQVDKIITQYGPHEGYTFSPSGKP